MGQQPSTKKQGLGLWGWLGVSFVAAGIGALATMKARSFYGALEQPARPQPASS